MFTHQLHRSITSFDFTIGGYPLWLIKVLHYRQKQTFELSAYHLLPGVSSFSLHDTGAKVDINVESLKILADTFCQTDCTDYLFIYLQYNTNTFA